MTPHSTNKLAACLAASHRRCVKQDSTSLYFILILCFLVSDLLLRKDQDIAELKSKVAEVMALMPYASVSNDLNPGDLSPHFSGNFTEAGASASATPPSQEEDVLSKSSLNPNASDYTPITKWLPFISKWSAQQHEHLHLLGGIFTLQERCSIFSARGNSCAV